MCNILKWFKPDCVDYTKPDKQVIVEPSNEKDIFESGPIIERPYSWADLLICSNQHVTSVTASSWR